MLLRSMACLFENKVMFMPIFVLVMNEGALEWSSLSKTIFFDVCVLFGSH